MSAGAKNKLQKEYKDLQNKLAKAKADAEAKAKADADAKAKADADKKAKMPETLFQFRIMAILQKLQQTHNLVVILCLIMHSSILLDVAIV